jgi:hypothetical protein
LIPYEAGNLGRRRGDNCAVKSWLRFATFLATGVSIVQQAAGRSQIDVPTYQASLEGYGSGLTRVRTVCETITTLSWPTCLAEVNALKNRGKKLEKDFGKLPKKTPEKKQLASQRDKLLGQGKQAAKDAEAKPEILADTFADAAVSHYKKVDREQARYAFMAVFNLGVLTKTDLRPEFDSQSFVFVIRGSKGLSQAALARALRDVVKESPYSRDFHWLAGLPTDEGELTLAMDEK